MIPDPLPFERHFLGWLEREGISGQRELIRLEDGGDFCVAYRFSPARPRHRVIAIHGAGNDALFAWIGFFKRQLLAGAEILTFDLPGHGRHSDSVWDEERLADWIRAATAAGIADSDDLPTHLVGVSLGGSVVLGCLGDLGLSVSSAVAIVAPRRIRFSLRAVASEFRPRIVSTLARGWQHYGPTGLLPSFGPFKREIYPLRLKRPTDGSPFGYVSILNASLDRLLEGARLDSVSTPVLLVYGALDRIVPVEQGHAFADELPRGRLFVAPGGTHLSTPLLPETEETVDRWLREHT